MLRYLCAIFLLLCVAPVSAAPAPALSGHWYPLPVAAPGEKPRAAELQPLERLKVTGGSFIYRAGFEVQDATPLVLDFRNSSVIGRFHHRIYDSRHRLVGEMDGGMQSRTPNPYFLRHGRDLVLAPGYYWLETEMSSPFLLAQPEPYLDTRSHYAQAIKPGNAVTLLCYGLLVGLAFYYAALSLIRRNPTDALYATFILGNLLYNGMALLIFPELLDIHGFYLTSFPILFSNCAYVLFVMRLLRIERKESPRLYAGGMGLLGLFAMFILIALFNPHWSLELDRLGVGFFLCFGFIAGLIRARQHCPTARMYLFAISVFFVLGSLSLVLSKSGANTFYIEHLGLFAVTTEALLLALVLARQFDEMRKEKERAITDSLDKSRFLAAASHDLRQPIHALALFVGELSAVVTTSQQRQLVKLVENSLQAMSGLLDSLLDISKLDAGLVKADIRPVALDALLDRMEGEYIPLAYSQQVSMSIHYSDAVVDTDPVLLERILQNLLGNAIRYTPPGGRVLLACRRRGANMRIEVRDNGIGIPKDRQQDVFREFVQIGNSERSRDKGLGLGLSIVQRLCSLLQIRLDLRSEPGEGSVFAVEVPVSRQQYGAAESPGDRVAGEVPETQAEASATRVLVVEDDALVQAGTQRLLASWGYRVDAAGSLQQAEQRLVVADYDLLICDYRLPDGDGIQVSEMAKAVYHRQLPCILISGDTAAEVLQAANAQGYHLLHKPLKPAKLHSLMMYVLKRG